MSRPTSIKIKLHASRFTLRELKEEHDEPLSLGIFVHTKQKRDIKINKKQ